LAADAAGAAAKKTKVAAEVVAAEVVALQLPALARHKACRVRRRALVLPVLLLER
jgi:hypothetical protein